MTGSRILPRHFIVKHTNLKFNILKAALGIIQERLKYQATYFEIKDKLYINDTIKVIDNLILNEKSTIQNNNNSIYLQK